MLENQHLSHPFSSKICAFYLRVVIANAAVAEWRFTKTANDVSEFHFRGSDLYNNCTVGDLDDFTNATITNIRFNYYYYFYF
jgi:hypothetical protein